MGNLTYSVDNMDVPELERTLNLYKNNTVKYYIGIGYILKQLKKKAQYDDWNTFCKERYGMDKTQASRCMDVNTRFSRERYGNGMELDEKYEGLNKSLLIEMLYLPSEMEDQVTPDMKVAEVRNMVKEYKQEQKAQQMHTDEILDQPVETARVYDVGDEIQGADLELICHLIRSYLEETGLGWDELAEFDFSKISGDYEHKGNKYSIFSDDEYDEYPISDKPGYMEIFKGFLDDRENEQKAMIYLRHEAWMRLMKQALADARKMCCYEDTVCRYMQESKRKANITGKACPEKCCMICPEVSGCSWACMSAMKKHFRSELETQPDQVNTELEMDFEEESIEESMELYQEIEEESEEVPLTVPIDLTEDEVIDAEYREITEADAISQLEETQEMEVEEPEVIHTPEDDMSFLREYHKEQSDLLDEYIKVGDLPDRLMRRQKLLVAALASMIYELEDTEEQEIQEQPEFPELKNKDQRKAFVDGFHSWPVWYQVQQASEAYYKYDLPDGSSIVVCEYNTYSEWKLRYRNEDPESFHYRYYLLKPGYHYLNDCKTSISDIVEHLKEVQKTVETP